MTESGASSTTREDDDPGRDPAGLAVPRNVLGDPMADKGVGEPKGSGDVGPADKPGTPADERETDRREIEQETDTP